MRSHGDVPIACRPDPASAKTRSSPRTAIRRCELTAGSLTVVHQAVVLRLRILRFVSPLVCQVCPPSHTKLELVKFFSSSFLELNRPRVEQTSE